MLQLLLTFAKIIPSIVPIIIEFLRRTPKETPTPVVPPIVPPVVPPIVVKPPLSVPKVLGYYYTDSKYGLFFNEVKYYAPLYRASIVEYLTSDITYDKAIEKFKSAILLANPSQILLSVDFRSEMFKAVFREVNSAGFWDKVIAVEAADEPGWGIKEGKDNYEKYLTALAELNLTPPKYGVGVTETKNNILNTNGWEVFDWVGLEAYVTAPGSTAQENKKVLYKDLDDMLGKVRNKPHMLIPQGYDRNGNWKNIDTLVQLQRDILNYPLGDAALPFYMIFAYGRPGGSRSHPKLTNVHVEYTKIPEESDGTGAEESDLYLRLSRTRELADTLENELQTNAWAGWRDPEAVARFCPDVKPLPPAAELSKFADEGAELDAEGIPYLTRLELEHPHHPGRSVVRKKVWAEFHTRLDDHLLKAGSYGVMLRGQPGHGVEYDSIKGWCEYIRKNP